jgi:uncharacterized protein YggE
MTVTTPTVAVRGSARRNAPPDFYVLGVGVDVRGSDAASVTDELARRFVWVDEAFSGVTTNDVTLERGPVSVRRTMSWDGAKNPVAEWVASRGIRLVGRDARRVSAFMALVDGLTRDVDGVTLDGPHWQLDDDNRVHAEVQLDAVRDAQTRAARYAEAVGGSLGDLVEIADPNVRDRGPVFLTRAITAMGMQAAGGLQDMDFTPQDVEVAATVEGRWVIALP